MSTSLKPHSKVSPSNPLSPYWGLLFAVNRLMEESKAISARLERIEKNQQTILKTLSPAAEPERPPITLGLHSRSALVIEQSEDEDEFTHVTL